MNLEREVKERATDLKETKTTVSLTKEKREGGGKRTSLGKNKEKYISFSFIYHETKKKFDNNVSSKFKDFNQSFCHETNYELAFLIPKLSL